MEQIARALAKVRLEGQFDRFPAEAESPRAPPSTVAPLFDMDPAVCALSPKILEAHRIVAWNKRDQRTAAFDILRTKVLQAMRERGWRTVAVASPTQGCGKTTAAINLAFSIAHQMPSEVVLVDFDFRQPRIAAYLGIPPQADLSALVERHGPLATHVVSAGGAQLRVVLNANSRYNAAELLAKPQVEQFFTDLKREKSDRIVVFDLPPLLVTDDAIAVLPHVDCTLMLVGEQVTRKPDVEEALGVLGNTNLLGVVLSRSRERLKSYY